LNLLLETWIAVAISADVSGLVANNRDAILAKRPYRRTRYFGRNELSGLVMGALRLAGEGNADRRSRK
jgi:hypothetical protein